MGFMDSMPSAGSIGLASRPKSRYIDKILMRQRDQKQQEAQMNMPMQQQPMAPAPGSNMFGGSSPFNRPNTLAMLLGGRGGA